MKMVQSFFSSNRTNYTGYKKWVNEPHDISRYCVLKITLIPLQFDNIVFHSNVNKIIDYSLVLFLCDRNWSNLRRNTINWVFRWKTTILVEISHLPHIIITQNIWNDKKNETFTLISLPTIGVQHALVDDIHHQSSVISYLFDTRKIKQKRKNHLRWWYDFFNDTGASFNISWKLRWISKFSKEKEKKTFAHPL